MADWETVVGLEIHVHLKTRTKMFCRCELEYFAEPNTRTCPVCLAHPGALPVANRKAVEWTIKLGLALGCEIAEHAVFSRKNYFYPDSPKGYQISQYDQPLCTGGSLLVPGADGDRAIGFVRAHLEEDAAKTVHVGGATGRKVGSAHSLVDFNRGGTPLVEIVTQPDIRTADEAVRFLRLLRQTIVELGISDAEMEKGTLRVDANVSVRPVGSDELPHALGAEEHELVHVHRPRHRGRCARPDRALRRGRRGPAAHVRLRAGQRPADPAPDEGGGRRLPLLPRARPGARAAAAGDGRTVYETSCRSCRASGLLACATRSAPRPRRRS